MLLRRYATASVLFETYLQLRMFIVTRTVVRAWLTSDHFDAPEALVPIDVTTRPTTIGLSVLVFWMLTVGLFLLGVFIAVNNEILVSWVMTPCSCVVGYVRTNAIAPLTA